MKTEPTPRDDAQQILDAIRRIVRELRVSARAAESKVGLSGAQLFVLSRLAGEKRLSLGELAARTLTDPSSASVVVAKLAEGGLVTRKRSAEDERRVELAITPAGRALLRKAPAAAQDRLIAAVSALASAQRRTLSRLLDEVVRGMGLDDAEAHLFFEDEKRPAPGAVRPRPAAGSARAPRPKSSPAIAASRGAPKGVAGARGRRLAPGDLSRAPPRAHDHGRSQ